MMCAKQVSAAQIALALAFFMLVFAGCGTGRVTKQVSGELKLEGKPFAEAMITFNPISSPTGKMRPAIGKPDANGKFTLTTYDPNDGAIPGEYSVTISWAPPPAGQLSGEGGFEAMQRARANPQAPPPSPVHENYTRVDKTPFKVTVPSNGPVVLNLTASGT